MASRPKIPIAMQRAIKGEAGYRCAIPTCRDKGPFDFEHIDEWSKVEKHEEHNIILLCVGCHARVTRGEISKEAIRAYKRNLAVISGRYSLYEKRLLEMLADCEQRLELKIEKSSILHVLGVINDGYFKLTELPQIMKVTDHNGRNLGPDPLQLLTSTSSGLDWAKKWKNGELVES